MWDTCDGGGSWDIYPPTLVTRGVMVSYDGWGEGHHFKEAGGAVQEVLCDLA